MEEEKKQRQTQGEMVGRAETDIKHKNTKGYYVTLMNLKTPMKKAIFWEEENREVSLFDRIKSRTSKVRPSVSAQKHPGQRGFPNQLSQAPRPHRSVSISPAALHTI